MKKSLLLILTFLISSLLSAQVILSEIHYNPANAGTTLGNDLEFLEITNIGSSPTNISGYFFSDGISYSFPANTILQPNQSITLAKNKAVLESHTGLTIFGQYTGGLKNSSEKITLTTLSLDDVFSVEYDDFLPWPTLADGLGKSLEYIGTGDQNDPSSWTSSSLDGGSPNVFSSSTPSQQSSVRVNEILANTSVGTKEKIELYNSSNTIVDISHWYLTDDIKEPKKHRFGVGTTIPANGYLVVDSDDFGSDFGLSSKGEGVFIFSSDETDLTGFSDGFTYTVSDVNQSFGLHQNSIDELKSFNLLSNTFGSSNDIPAVGPLVITDIMHSPNAFFDEFLIVKNISDSTVSTNSPYLVDSNAIRISGISFKFDFNNPSDLLPNESIILIPNTITPEDFRTKYSIASTVKLFTYTGALSSSEKISIDIPIKRDIIPLSGGIQEYDNHYKILDQVEYSNSLPWPTEADGSGKYLQRTNSSLFADDPALWEAVNHPVLNIKKNNNDVNFSFYPTIAHNVVTIVPLTSSNNSGQIYDAMGNLQSTFTTQGKTTIDISSLSSGIYFLHMNGGNKRFIKQ